MPVFGPGVLIAVGAGGAIGALARYGLKVAVPVSSGSFPVATLVVNVVGAVILGALSAIPASRLSLSSRTRALVGPGFCGGLTTFSTMSLETSNLWSKTAPTAVSYIAISVIGAPLAVVVGRLIGARLFPGPAA